MTINHKTNGIILLAEGNIDYTRLSKAFEVAYKATIEGAAFAKARATQCQIVSDCSGPSWSHTSYEREYETVVEVEVIDRNLLDNFIESGAHWSHLLDLQVEYPGNRYGGGVYTELL